MIWEQQTSIIVMVTRCEEGNKVCIVICLPIFSVYSCDTEWYIFLLLKSTSILFLILYCVGVKVHLSSLGSKMAKHIPFGILNIILELHY